MQTVQPAAGALPSLVPIKVGFDRIQVKSVVAKHFIVGKTDDFVLLKSSNPGTSLKFPCAT